MLESRQFTVIENSTRHVYYISDSTGITVEELGRSVLDQFNNINFLEKTFAFIDDIYKINKIKDEILNAHLSIRPIIFFTFSDEILKKEINQIPALSLDCLDIFTTPLAKEFGQEPLHTSRGRLQREEKHEEYKRRIDALNFTMQHDDGILTYSLSKADIILMGVSRSGKTPTSLYLALHYGIFSANYPLVDEDLTSDQIPRPLTGLTHKIYGLTISPQRLAQIRNERRPDSHYATVEKCQQELNASRRIFESNGIPYLDATRRSIEELASKILQEANLKRYL